MKNKQILIVLSGMLYSLGVGFAERVYLTMINTWYLSAISDDGNRKDYQHFMYLYYSKVISSGIGFLIIAIVMQIYGRKIAHIVVNSSLIISIIIFIVANHISLLYLAQVIQGITATGIILQAIVLSEYCHEARRGIFMCLVKVSQFFGIFISLFLNNWMYWRYSYIFGIVPPCAAIALTMFWPESPHFHAMNAEYEGCEKSFKLLHGESEKRRRELESIIEVQKKKLEQENKQHRSIIATFRKFSDKIFWKVFAIMTTLTVLHSVTFSSNLFTEMFSYNQIQKLFGQLGNFYYVIFHLIPPLISCSIILIDRKTVLLVFGFVSMPLMFLASLLASMSNESVSLLLFIVVSFYNFFFELSIVPVCSILFGELYFLEHRGIGTFASGIVFVVLKLIFSIISPLVGEYAGYLFLNIAWVTALCLVILFFILPETNGKTLQEIEFELRGERVLSDASAQNVEMGNLLNTEEKEVNM